MIANTAYLSFVQTYTLSDNTGKVWWDNDSWVESNINVNINGCFPMPCDFKILNAEEKKFCKKYPVSMFFIANNRQVALIATNEEYGLPTNNTLIHPNNKFNAFIHALFCALNSNNLFIGEERARLFAEAHESDTPPQFQIESVMDGHNNEVGKNIGINNSLALIIYNVRVAMVQGYLRYLFPLNMSDGCFWGCTWNSLGTHGIDSNTSILRTDQ